MAPSVGSMADLVKIPRVIDGHLVVDEKDVVAVYRVTSKLNPVTADGRDLDAAVQRLTGALNALRAGERIQVVVDCRRYDPAADILKMNQRISPDAAPGFRSYYPAVLQESFENYCRWSFVPVLSYYLLFSYQAPRGRMDGSPEPSLVQRAAEVDRRAGDFLTAMTDANIKVSALTEREIVELLDEALNPSRLAPLPPEALAEAGAASGVRPSRAELLLRSPIANPAPKPGRRYDHLQVGSMLVRSFSFIRVPGANIQRSISDLILSQTAFRFAFHVEGLSQERTREFIEKKRSAAVGAVMIGQGRGTQGSEEQASEYDQLLRRASRREVRFCKWSGYLTVFGKDEGEIQAKGAELSSAFADLVPDEGVYRQVEYWLSALPLGVDAAGTPLWAETTGVAGLMPFFDFDSNSPEGGTLLGFGPANQPVFWDPWSREVINGNIFVCGSPGSGKSFGINNNLNRLAPQAFDVSVIDKAKSYKFSCLAAGGDYVEWDLEGRYAVNVWDVLPHDRGLVIDMEDFNDLDEQGTVKADKIEAILGLAEVFMAEAGQSLPKIERSLLLEAVQQTYHRFLLFWEDVEAEWAAREQAARRKSDRFTVPVPAERRALVQASIPTFTELAVVLRESVEKDPDHQYAGRRRDLLQKLQPAVSGNLKGLVNRRTTLKAEGRMRVFDISSLPENAEIQGLAMQIVTTWLMTHWRKNKARGVRQIAVLDELYFFMLFKSGRTMLDNLSRRSRHLGLACIMATQQLDDVLLYPETPSILRNAPTKVLYQQDKSVVEKLTGLLGLSDQEQAHLASLRTVKGQFSNCLYLYGSKRNILTIRADPATRWLNTTEPNFDLPRRDKALAQAGGDPWEAVKLLIAQGA
ncbi:MAG TPA: hypothetical protein VK914_07915 [bacterium]|jgi:hypothetical protein|nr:hypothetical protein [bacterium]